MPSAVTEAASTGTDVSHGRLSKVPPDAVKDARRQRSLPGCGRCAVSIKEPSKPRGTGPAKYADDFGKDRWGSPSFQRKWGL